MSDPALDRLAAIRARKYTEIYEPHAREDVAYLRQALEDALRERDSYISRHYQVAAELECSRSSFTLMDQQLTEAENKLEDAQRERDRLRVLVKHFGGCAGCCDGHGAFPESVSCYCDCHRGDRKRWPALKDQALAVLPPDPSPQEEAPQ